MNFSIISKFLLIAAGCVWLSCAKDNPVAGNDGQTAADINEYIQTLDYNQEEMLEVQETGAENSTRETLEIDTSETTTATEYTSCVKTRYSLKQNFEDISVLRPLAGIVWPGALVKGNASLMDGLPEPIALPRAAMTFTVDLPGIGEGGVKYIENPSNSTVQAAIDSALEYWNANAYQDGYVNASSSSYRISTSYSSQQLALDVGLNASWATGDVSAQFSYNSNEQKKVVMAVYKQAFYSIDMDTPQDPASVFAAGVSLDDIEASINSATPPAYVASVVYGRIIMFRMETSQRVTSGELESAFRYAAGYAVDGTLEARYKSILQQSTIEVITLGGNAEVASYAVSARSAGELEPIIKGENAVYSRNNPGVPISYTVRYLKDHSLAKLGYFTEYTASECSTTKTADIVRIVFKEFKVIKDCDGVGKGDFEIWANISATSGTDYHKSSISLSNGGTVNMNTEYTFKANRVENNYFTVTFTCKEWDKDILGNTYGDSRMNKKSGSITHKFSNQAWTNLGNGTRTIVLNDGNSACSTQFTYSISIQ